MEIGQLIFFGYQNNPLPTNTYPLKLGDNYIGSNVLCNIIIPAQIFGSKKIKISISGFGKINIEDVEGDFVTYIDSEEGEKIAIDKRKDYELKENQPFYVKSYKMMVEITNIILLECRKKLMDGENKLSHKNNDDDGSLEDRKSVEANTTKNPLEYHVSQPIKDYTPLFRSNNKIYKAKSKTNPSKSSIIVHNNTRLIQSLLNDSNESNQNSSIEIELSHEKHPVKIAPEQTKFGSSQNALLSCENSLSDDDLEYFCSRKGGISSKKLYQKVLANNQISKNLRNESRVNYELIENKDDDEDITAQVNVLSKDLSINFSNEFISKISQALSTPKHHTLTSLEKPISDEINFAIGDKDICSVPVEYRREGVMNQLENAQTEKKRVSEILEKIPSAAKSITTKIELETNQKPPNLDTISIDTTMVISSDSCTREKVEYKSSSPPPEQDTKSKNKGFNEKISMKKIKSINEKVPRVKPSIRVEEEKFAPRIKALKSSKKRILNYQKPTSKGKDKSKKSDEQLIKKSVISKIKKEPKTFVYYINYLTYKERCMINPHKRNAYKMIFTGFNKNADYYELRDEVKKIGGKLVDDYRQPFNVLVINKFKRTIKFLTAINKGVYILNIQWIKDSLKHKQILPINEKYFYQNKKSERQYGFNLSNSLQTARIKKNGFLHNWKVYIPNNIYPSFEEVKYLVISGGGDPIKTKPRNFKENTLILAPEYDYKLICYFYKLNFKVYKAEVIFSGCLNQFLDLNQDTI